MKQNELDFKIFAEFNFTVAENPLWNPSEQQLYWKGWHAGQIYRKAIDGHPARFETFELPIGLIGGLVLARNGGLLIFAQHGRVWHWQPGRVPVRLAELPDADDKTYFNDLIADPAGRVYVGVLGHDFFDQLEKSHPRHGFGALWRFDPDGSFHCLEPKIGCCPNGMAFSRDLNYFFFAVTDENMVYRYDYDGATGNLSHRVPLMAAPGCDGMTVDADDALWVAQSGGRPLSRYSSSGKLLREYYLPVRGITSLTFGGPENRTIFVTTADYPPGSDSTRGAGGIWLAESAIAGVPEFYGHFQSLPGFSSSSTP